MNNNNGKDIFEWQVHEEYTEEMHEVLFDGLHYRLEIFIAGQGNLKKYHPSDYPTLYTEFQRISDKQSAFKFIREFGLPNGQAENLNQILMDARNVQECLRLYEALKQNLPLRGIDLEELRDKDRVNASEKLKKYSKKYIQGMGEKAWFQIILDKVKAAEQERTPDQGREALLQHVNRHLEGVKPVLAYYKGEFTFNRTCDSLLQYIYLQIFDLISNRNNFVQCLDCGSWFTPTKKGMRFCPPLPGQRKSSCSNRYYVRKHREEN
ncbi:MAG: hypothetical protein A4E55_00762 [Pelotomaculum sp. PtaU1.Bin035]|nr:MAG: hypothetical protein A4E55_00762 [Pelotomaculum sp. PtaU1.Bin035]